MHHTPAGQAGPGDWAQALPDRIAADSIVNRLANNARTINLGQIDMRRQRGRQARPADGDWEYHRRNRAAARNNCYPIP